MYNFSNIPRNNYFKFLYCGTTEHMKTFHDLESQLLCFQTCICFKLISIFLTGSIVINMLSLKDPSRFSILQEGYGLEIEDLIYSPIIKAIVLVDLNEFSSTFSKVQHFLSRHQKTTSNLPTINLKGYG